MSATNVGAATRMLWQQLAPEWTDYGEDDWAAARAQLPRGAGSEEECTKLAVEIFWQGREALLLSSEELHVELWEALCRNVSPPWPDPADVPEPPPPKPRKERRAREKRERKKADDRARERVVQERDEVHPAVALGPLALEREQPAVEVAECEQALDGAHVDDFVVERDT